MPEQLTRYPEVTLQVLRSAGARCAEGAPQQILHACPPAQFCKLPGGELCVYGLAQAAQMTQVSAAQWRALPVPRQEAPWRADSAVLGALLVLAFALGAGSAALLRSRRRPQQGVTP